MGYVKLSPEKKREMIERYEAGDVTQIELAAEYNVSLSSVNHWIRYARAEKEVQHS